MNHDKKSWFFTDSFLFFPSKDRPNAASYSEYIWITFIILKIRLLVSFYLNFKSNLYLSSPACIRYWSGIRVRRCECGRPGGGSGFWLSCCCLAGPGWLVRSEEVLLGGRTTSCLWLMDQLASCLCPISSCHASVYCETTKSDNVVICLVIISSSYQVNIDSMHLI